MRILLVAGLMLFPSLLTAADTDEPFTDPADSNPAEGMRKSGRLMSRLDDGLSGEELARVQRDLEDRLTRTILTMEREARNQSSNSSNSGNSKSKPSGSKKPNNGQSSGQRRDQEHRNTGSSKPEGSQPEGGEKPDGGDKEGPDGEKAPKPPEGAKTKVVDDSERWGSLPPKVREALKTNLGRDVPAEIEEDMRDFTERMKELD